MAERTEAQRERNRARGRADRLRKAAILMTNIEAGHTGLIQETRRRMRGQIRPDPKPKVCDYQEKEKSHETPL